MLEFIYDYESNDHIAYKVLDKTNNTLHMGFCIDITSVIDYIYIPYSSLIFLDTKSSDFIIMFINEIYNLYQFILKQNKGFISLTKTEYAENVMYDYLLSNKKAKVIKETIDKVILEFVKEDYYG